jgi:hypothetical protein
LPTTGTFDDATLDQIQQQQHKIEINNVSTKSSNKIDIIETKLDSGVYKFETKW